MLQIVNVSVTLLHADGRPVSEALVTASLTKIDTDSASGMVFPAAVEAETNASGVAILKLWPNSNGVAGSQYRFKAFDPESGRKLLDEVATVPTHAANLRDILLLPPPTPLPYDEASILAIQQARSRAVAAASDADSFRAQSEINASNAQQSSDISGQSAFISEQSRQASEIAAQDAEQSKQQSSLNSQSAQQSVLNINLIRQAIDNLASSADQSAQNSSLSELAARDYSVFAQEKANEAFVSASRVEGESLRAAQHAIAASLSASQSEQSKVMASQSSSESAISRNLARDYRDDAKAARARARVYRESARRWAQELEDVPVRIEDGEEKQFSAFHWAEKARKDAALVLREDKEDIPAERIEESDERQFISKEQKEKLDAIEEEANKTVVSQERGESEEEVMSQKSATDQFLGRREDGAAELVAVIDDGSLPTNLYRLFPDALGTYPYDDFTKGGATLQVIKWGFDSSTQTLVENRAHGRQWQRLVVNGIPKEWQESILTANILQEVGESETDTLSQDAITKLLDLKVDKDADPEEIEPIALPEIKDTDTMLVVREEEKFLATVEDLKELFCCIKESLGYVYTDDNRAVIINTGEYVISDASDIPEAEPEPDPDIQYPPFLVLTDDGERIVISTGEYVTYDEAAGALADISYIRTTPMTISVGGAIAGTTFNGTLADALDKILYNSYFDPNLKSVVSRSGKLIINTLNQEVVTGGQNG